MTEVQLQKIVSQQGIKEDGSSELDMLTVNGRRVSKWSLEALHFGKKVPEDHKQEVLAHSQGYVGETSVYPTKNGTPRILTQFLDNPYKFELRDEYVRATNPKPLPSVRATYYHGKPATRRVLEHFVRNTPVVSRCDHPRCLSRLVIVPKRDPGAPKSADPTSYRVTMNALINGALKPTASTLPLATDEIKKLHHYRYYLQMDAANAFWSIPLDEESRRLTAFQTHEGVFAWDRLTMGTRPASAVQQTAYHRAMDEYLPREIRHRFATYADDLACGADTLEELFELYKALLNCLDKAGIQVKASKVKYGVEEISFHNYTISKDWTRPKDENLLPIRNCSTPTNVTELKAFLGCTQQMSQYCQHYGLIAVPLHRLTRDKEPFPKPWLEGTDYDIAFHRIKTMMLDGTRFLWNKDSSKRLFIEVDACNEGWGACAYQFEDGPPEGIEDEGRYRLHSKEYRRVVSWVSKAWSDYERELPVFYREALGRLLTLEHFRNLIETQEVTAGTTVYTDHAPSTYVGSLSNKGRLSTWKIHETSDLISAVQTLYKAGEYLSPPHGLADPLSRLPRGETVQRLMLPALLRILLDNLPEQVCTATNMRVHAEKDTTVAARIVQKWRRPTNPISTVRKAPTKADFLIFASYADKVTHQIADHIRNGQPFAALVPIDLLHEIDKDKNGCIDEKVKALRQKMPTVVMTAANQLWLISHPDITVTNTAHQVLVTVGSRRAAQSTDEAFEHHVSACLTEFIHGITAPSMALTRSKAKGKAAAPDVQKPPASKRWLQDETCKRGQRKSTLNPLSFSSAPRPDPLAAWVGKQGKIPLPTQASLIENVPGQPRGLRHILDHKERLRVIVPSEQRVRLIKQEHQTLLHVGGPRVAYSLRQKYYWPRMSKDIHRTCAACPDCQKAKVRRETLHAEFRQAEEKHLPLPRQQYGIDFYGHADGEILVAIDLCTREVLLWFLKNRKQDTVAKALLTGLIFQKGVPMLFRNDEAGEFVAGVVAAMNSYLGIEQITTGGYNPRGNAVAERFMATLGHMLRVSSDAEYKAIDEYLPCIAFAHNCTYNSAIEATPFEIGHGFPARTVAEARMSIPKLRLATEEGMPVKLADKWEKGLHKKVLELSSRYAKIAQMHSEWHRRMTAEKLNQSGKKVDEHLLKPGMDVYFYRPPTQGETLRRDRIKKHLYHYHGPAKVVRRLRDRQYEIEHLDGKTRKRFPRDASMLIPAKDMPKLLSDEVEPAERTQKELPSAHEQGLPLKEGELVITKDHPSSTEWYVAEVIQILPTETRVKYFSTYTPPLDSYANADPTARAERLSQARFRRTWYIRSGKHRGRATVTPPYPNNPELRAWSGPLLKDELNQCLLARNLRLSAEGQLDNDSLRIAVKLPIPHATTPAVEDATDGNPEEAAVTPPLFLFSQDYVCGCDQCRSILSNGKLLGHKRRHDGV